MSKASDLPLLRQNLEVEGALERILFHNESNGYTVLRVKPRHKADFFAAVGHMVPPQPGVGLRLTGQWVEHPRFGRQFHFTAYECLLPATAEGICSYLASGLIKGVRQKTAMRIVEMFGEATFEVLDNNPDLLGKVKGISAKTLESIKKSWAEHKSIRDLIMFLQPHDISTSYAVRIFKHYGPYALDVVQENPYRLAMDIHGIGFATADSLAMKLGIGPESPLRAEAAVLYALRQTSDEGHLYYPLNELTRLTAESFNVEPALAEAAIFSLQHQERLVIEDFATNNLCLPLFAAQAASPASPSSEDDGPDSRGVYLSQHYHCESGISHYLQRILRSPKSVSLPRPEEALTEALEKSGLELAEGQVEAVRQSLRSKVLVITGGPGTGKTTIINTILKVFQGAKARILLAAPTGRAAKRMAESSGQEAKTIHRLLEYSPNEDGFARNEDNPLACGLLVVDEASMLDNTLMYHLLKAVPLGATVIFVGDVNQLPSVGPGNVLRDIISSGVVPVVELTEIFRQAAESSIVTNSHCINRGIMPQLRPLEGELSDFYFIRQEDPEKAADMIAELVSSHIPRRFKFHPVNDIQVLTPMHKGAAGATALNHKLQGVLNPKSEHLMRGEKQYRLDDKVMQIRNNYDKDVFNGDIGRICYLDAEEKELTVRFDDRNITYAFDELDEIVPAYAISIHKSQGSEYPAVVMPILTQHYVMLQRNLLYTGVTRGKKLVVVVGSIKALNMAVKNNSTVRRFTRLAQRLRAGGEA